MRAIFLALALAACTQAPPPAAPADPAPVPTAPANADEATAQDTCGMAAFQHLVGSQADRIDRAKLPPGARIITPDSMVTQDFSPQRLNIFTGTDGKVSSLRCF